MQYPPQKYHFTKPKSTIHDAPTGESTTLATIAHAQGHVDVEHQNADSSEPQQQQNNKTKKKPVIRGRKVSQLAKLFEERTEGLEILNSM